MQHACRKHKSWPLRGEIASRKRPSGEHEFGTAEPEILRRADNLLEAWHEKCEPVEEKDLELLEQWCGLPGEEHLPACASSFERKSAKVGKHGVGRDRHGCLSTTQLGTGE